MPWLSKEKSVQVDLEKTNAPEVTKKHNFHLIHSVLLFHCTCTDLQQRDAVWKRWRCL